MNASSPIRALLVDDDEDDFLLTRALFGELERPRIELEWVRSVEAGLASLRERSHDIYLVDYRIGADSGLDFLRAAQESAINAPVILLTGQGSHDIDLAAMAAGAADYLVKGHFDAEQLGRAVRHALDRARDHAELAASAQRHRVLFEEGPLPMWVYAVPSLKFLAVNEVAIRHYGYSREEFMQMNLRDVRPPEDIPRLESSFAETMPRLVNAGVWRHRRRDGSLIDVDVFVHEFTYDGKRARISLLLDVTSQRKAEAEMRLLARAFESSKSGLMISDARVDGQPITYVNPALLRMTGYSEDEVLGRNGRFLHGDDSEQLGLEQIREALAEEVECEVVLRNYRKSGTLFWNQLSISPVRDADGTVTHFLSVSTDLTERRRQEAELAYLASHDPATGLPRFFDPETAFQRLIDDATRYGTSVSAHYVDIDRFHTVNESLGHRLGDEALRLLADRLKIAAGEHGRLWRVAGDEFVVLQRHAGDADEAYNCAESLRMALEPPLIVAGYELFLSGTIGVATYPLNARSPAELLNCAEAAMIRAKRLGRNSVLAFTNEQASALRDRLELGLRLRDAIRGGEMRLYYQPQISGRDGRIVGVEALLRWYTPDRGIVLPGRFINVAEELGLVIELGRWVLREACHQAREWLDAGLDDIRIAVNVSALQLQRPSFVNEVDAALKSARLPPHMLELELTESAIMENTARVAQTLQDLKTLGVWVALDDFGIGYSSLNYLKRFRIDKLKIDQSFVRDVAQESGEAAIVRAIITLGHQLRMTVVAEGVETESQLGFLRQNHCDEFQGNLFGLPLPVGPTTDLLRRRYLSPTSFTVNERARHLLLVDDEENVLRSLTRLFRRDGYIVHSAHGAIEAFDVLARHPVQVIVSDQRMPNVSGTEFLSRVREMYPDTMRLVLSGYTDLSTVTEAINRGSIYKFLTKPWDDEQLRAHIREAFRNHEERYASRDGIAG